MEGGITSPSVIIRLVNVLCGNAPMSQQAVVSSWKQHMEIKSLIVGQRPAGLV